jgi:hypothetical protein
MPIRGWNWVPARPKPIAPKIVKIILHDCSWQQIVSPLPSGASSLWPIIGCQLLRISLLASFLPLFEFSLFLVGSFSRIFAGFFPHG